MAESKSKTLESADLTEIFKHLLKQTDLNANVREQIDRTIAEIIKIDGQRQRFTNQTIIENLLQRLAAETKQQQQQKPSSDKKLQTISLNDTQLLAAIQLCRALGNICYNNEDARNIILNTNGDVIIVNLLDLKLDASNELEVTFAKFRGGLVSNYLLGGEHLAKHAMELNILQRIEVILDDCISHGDAQQNEEILLSTLQPLSLLTENVADLNFTAKLNGQLAKILTISKDPDVAEMCLEMLNYQADNGIEKLEDKKNYERLTIFVFSNCR